MKVRGISFLAIAATAAVIAVVPAFSAHLPTHGAVVHFDLNAPPALFDILPAAPGVPAVPVPAVGGPCIAFATGEACRFVDALFSLPEPWHWESEIFNPNAAAVAFPIAFFWPGGALGGVLVLGPGAAFTFDIHFAEVPEVGPWVWSAFSGLAFPIGVDTSVTENPRINDTFICNIGTCTFDPGTPTRNGLYFELTAIPEPGMFVILGSGSAILLLLARRRGRLNRAAK
jgi:hypothetical protein